MRPGILIASCRSHRLKYALAKRLFSVQNPAWHDPRHDRHTTEHRLILTELCRNRKLKAIRTDRKPPALANKLASSIYS